MRISQHARRGFTALEAIVSLGVLATAIVLASELVLFGVAERRRNVAHQAAVETATNVLEAARACAWDKLDDAWAAAQTLPDDPPLAKARLSVRVESKALDRPALKRVTVEIEQPKVPLVRQTAWFAARETSAGEKP